MKGIVLAAEAALGSIPWQSDIEVIGRQRQADDVPPELDADRHCRGKPNDLSIQMTAIYGNGPWEWDSRRNTGFIPGNSIPLASLRGLVSPQPLIP